MSEQANPEDPTTPGAETTPSQASSPDPATSYLKLDQSEPTPSVAADLSAVETSVVPPSTEASTDLGLGEATTEPAAPQTPAGFGGFDLAPDVEPVDQPRYSAEPVAGLEGAEVSDPYRVAQATYGQTQQAYQQPPFQQEAYQTPAQPGYPPQPYLQQGVSQGSAPVPYRPAGTPAGYGSLSQAEENTWTSAAHWSALVASLVGLGFLGPLLVLVTKGNQSPRVRAAAAESLNFEITFIISMIVSVIAIFLVVGIFTTILLPILWLVLRIVAAVATARGENYAYPVNLRLVK